MAMAKALARSGLAFDLHVFARSVDHLPFGADLDRFGEAVTRHLGLSSDGTGAKLHKLVANYAFARHLYVCGPGPMLDATRAAAAAAGWPDEAIHFEYFKNDHAIDTRSHFTVELARSAMTLEIPAGKSILTVLRENGIEAPSSCEQGACGTCLTALLDGVPDHQDVYLNASERRAGKSMLTCVSRALSPRLVLDI
jgi:ferredoxin